MAVLVLEHRVHLKCNISVKLKMAALVIQRTEGEGLGSGTRVRLKQSLREANTLEGDRKSERCGSDGENTLDTAQENHESTNTPLSSYLTVGLIHV